MARTVHVIGAGLSGLAAAIRLADSAKVAVHEAAGQPGGRCRSYYDAATGLVIDNGNHLVLSGNKAALSFLQTVGTEDRLVGPAHAEFPFADLASGERWTLRLSDGRLPWWVLNANDGVPGTRALDYARYAPLLWASGDKTVCDVVPCNGALYQRLMQPLLLAALNIDPREGSAALASEIVRETLAAGGLACRPLIARQGLSTAFIEPAIEYLQQRGASVQLSHELRGFGFEGGRIASLDFGSEQIALGAEDAVVLAVPPYAAASLLPELTVPTEFRAIVNGHFRVDPPAGCPPIIGVINATTEWIFAFEGRLSVTISSGDRLLNEPREQLANTIWKEVCAVTGASGDLPRWQIVRERRATFAATPQQNARRPKAETAWRNLFLAGDWTATGLPATIEGSIRSGFRAAELLT